MERRLAPTAELLSEGIAHRWADMCAVEELFEAVDRGDAALVTEQLATKTIREAFETDPGWLVDFIGHAGSSQRIDLYGWVEEQLRLQPDLPNMGGTCGWTPLHAAAMGWNARFAKLLLRFGARPDVLDKLGHTPLYRAANGYVEPKRRTPEDGTAVVRLLIAHGADVDLRCGVQGTAPLHMVARRGNEGIAAILLENGADLEVRDNKGETPLRRAVNCNHTALVSLFLRHGADVNTRDNRGVKPLSAAHHTRIAALLREYGGTE